MAMDWLFCDTNGGAGCGKKIFIIMKSSRIEKFGTSWRKGSCWFQVSTPKRQHTLLVGKIDVPSWESEYIQ
jgi:hypothetical protein